MAIEGRKDAKETFRREEEQVQASRKHVTVRRRMTRVVDDSIVPTGGSQLQGATPQPRET